MLAAEAARSKDGAVTMALMLSRARSPEKDLLQHVDLGVAIQAISGFGCARRLEEPDFVVVAQGARTHAGEPSELLDCVFTAFRGYRLPTRQ